MQKPKVLRQGDTVALVNPAGMLPERFSRQLEYIKEYLEASGFMVKDHVVYQDWEKAQNRVKGLHRAFDDPDVKAIFPICGGKLIYDVVPKLDYERIGKNPKIFCGSSKVSSLTTMIAERSNLVSIFGPHLNFLNPKASKRENLFSVRSFWNMLLWDWHGKSGLSRHEAAHFFSAPRQAGEEIRIKNIYRSPGNIKREEWRDNFYHALAAQATVSGSLLPASLEVLIEICRVGMVPNVSGKMLMLDALDTSLGQTFALLQDFGAFVDIQSANALIFTSICERTDRRARMFTQLGDRTHVVAFLERVADFVGRKLPVLFGFPLGHCAYKLTLPVGVEATIHTESGDIVLHEIPYEM